MVHNKENKKDSIMRYAFFIAIGLIFVSFFFLNREAKVEILGCLFVAAAGWLEVVRIPMKERNPLIELKTKD